jgi:hypothetical protein
LLHCHVKSHDREANCSCGVTWEIEPHY